MARRGAGDEPAEPQVVDTLGGRIHVRWGHGAAATPHGQLVFFAKFLAATGDFERWMSGCPLSYRSGSAPDKISALRRSKRQRDRRAKPHLGGRNNHPGHQELGASTTPAEIKPNTC